MTRIGEITVYWGSMFSGKSSALINHLRNAEGRVVCFKPSFDTRDASDKIVTHDGAEFPVISVNRASEMFLHVDEGVRLIGIDEAMLFGDDPTLIPTVTQLRDLGFDLVVTGLDVDRHGVPYPQMSYLASIADECIKFRTRCSCGELASISYYHGDGSTLIGRDDLYEPLCRTCYSQRKPPVI